MPTTTKTPDTDPVARVEELRTEKERLEGQLSELGERLSSTKEQIEDATDPDAAVELRMERQAAEATIEDLEDDLDEVKGELQEARQAARREEQIEKLVALAQEAEEAKGAFHDAQERLIEAIGEPARELKEAWNEWKSAHSRFKELYQGTERSVYEPWGRRKGRLDQARALAAEVKERGGPIGAAMAHPFVDHKNWAGVKRSEMAPKSAGSIEEYERKVVDAVLDAAPLS